MDWTGVRQFIALNPSQTSQGENDEDIRKGGSGAGTRHGRDPHRTRAEDLFRRPRCHQRWRDRSVRDGLRPRSPAREDGVRNRPHRLGSGHRRLERRVRQASGSRHQSAGDRRLAGTDGGDLGGGNEGGAFGRFRARARARARRDVRGGLRRASHRHHRQLRRSQRERNQCGNVGWGVWGSDRRDVGGEQSRSAAGEASARAEGDRVQGPAKP